MSEDIVLRSSYVDNLDQQRKSSNKRYAGMFFRFLLILGLCILFIRVFWKLRGGNSDLSFTGFLEWFSNLNSVEISLDISDFAIRGNWGILNGLRNFLNIFANLFGVVVWLFSNIINILLYAISFVKFLFV